MPEALNSPLYLLGTGMRRRRVIIDFDVYQIGVAVSHHALSKAVQWSNARKLEGGPLSSFVLQREPTLANRVQVAVILHIKRSISKATFLDAFRTAFEGVDAKSFQEFEQVIERCIGVNGVQPEEEVAFYFLNNGDLVFARNGEFVGSLRIEEISQRLLDVYTDPVRSVSKELCECIEQHVAAVSETVFR